MVVSESSVDDGFQSSKVLFKSGSGLWYTEHTRNMMHVLAYVASMITVTVVICIKRPPLFTLKFFAEGSKGAF